MATAEPPRPPYGPTFASGSGSAAALDPDLESLQQEREFLLRSLADLDAELEAGDIEDSDYRSLTDDYTARTAAVLKAIQAAQRSARASPAGASPRVRSSSGTRSSGPPGRARPRPTAAGLSRTPTGATSGRASGSASGSASGPAPGSASGPAGPVAAGLARRRRRRTGTWVGAVLVFGALAAWAVTQSTANRQSNQTITGNSQIATTTAPAGGVDPRLAEANTDINKGDVEGALELYQAILKEDPNQPVALATSGWLEAEAGVSAKRADLIDAGLAQIVQAEQIAPNYADEHFFRGYLLLQAKNDASDAVTELRTYLGLADPGDPNIPAAQTWLQEAIKQAGPRVPAGPNAASTTTTPIPTSKP